MLNTPKNKIPENNTKSIIEAVATEDARNNTLNF